MTAQEIAEKFVFPFTGDEVDHDSEFYKDAKATWDAFFEAGGMVHNVTVIPTRKLGWAARGEITIVVELDFPIDWEEEITMNPSGYDTPARRWWNDLRDDAGHQVVIHGVEFKRLIFSEVY